MLDGLILEESHQDDAALARYLAVLRQGENNPDVARRALRLLYAKGDYAAANALLRRLEGQQVLFTTELFREQSGRSAGCRITRGPSRPRNGQPQVPQTIMTTFGSGNFSASSAGAKRPKKPCNRRVGWARRPRRRGWRWSSFSPARAGKTVPKRPCPAGEKIPAAVAPLALAECFEILGKTDEAGRQYALALKQKPNDPGVVRSVAIYYVRRGDLRKAADELEKIVTDQVAVRPSRWPTPATPLLVSVPIRADIRTCCRRFAWSIRIWPICPRRSTTSA